MRKGFTLSELLVCLAVLALVLVIAIPSIMGAVDRNRDKQYDLYLDEISSALDTYIENNRNSFTTSSCNPNCIVTLETLVNSGLLDEDVMNPKTSNTIKDDKDSIVYVTMNVDGSFHFTFEGVTR